MNIHYNIKDHRQYRVWSKINKYFEYGCILDYKREDIELFTRFFDMDGQPVYEGDILEERLDKDMDSRKPGNKFRFQIVFEPPDTFKCLALEHPSHYFFARYYLMRSKIVGNIHEPKPIA